MKFSQKLQHLAQKHSLLQVHKFSRIFTSLLVTSTLFCTLPARSQTSYLGINNGTGYNTDPTFTDRSIQQTKDLGIELVRMGMDGVYGNREGASFIWSARDLVVNKYIQAGLRIHAPIAPRYHVYRDSNYEQWKANFRYFARNVMERYKGKIFYYIIDNEPDLDYGNGTMTAQQCVDMTRIAYETAKSIDPNIKIESPPPTSPGSYILKEMIDLGIDKVSDFIGIHAYGGQIREGEFGNPWRLLAARGIRKPVVVSESGTISSWYQGSSTERENYRKRWFVIFGQQLKRYGYNHALFFDLDNNGEWAISPNFNPTPTYYQIKDLRLNKKFSNPGFELANNADNEWVHFDNDDSRLGSSPNVAFVCGDANGARGGNCYARLDSGRAFRGKQIFVRRIVGDLPKNQNVKIGAWVYVNGGATATLKALGYDYLDGDAEISKTAGQKNVWEYLEITVPISRYWTVIELGTSGTGNSGDYVKWDDVSVVTP